MKYSEKSTVDKTKYGNSQDFVDALLKSINIQLELPLSIALFLNRIKIEGSTKFVFEYSEKFQYRFRLLENSITFDTHHQLDKFIHKIQGIDPKFEKNWSDEYKLLKSFDRAFWMKFISFGTEIERLKTLRKEEKENELKIKSISEEIERYRKEMQKYSPYIDDFECPMGDPILTQSFIQ